MQSVDEISYYFKQQQFHRKVNGAKVVINTHTKSISARQKHEHKHRGEKAEN